MCFVSAPVVAGFIFTIVPLVFAMALASTFCYAGRFARPAWGVAVTSLLYVGALLLVSCDTAAFQGEPEFNPFVTFAVIAGIVWANARRRQQEGG